MNKLAICLIIAAVFCCADVRAQTGRSKSTIAAQDWESQPVEGQPYTRYFRDLKASPRYSYFVAKPKAKGDLPLVIFVQGSGAGSLFVRSGNRTSPTYGHASAFDVFGETANVMVVEKPGVPFLFNPQDKSNLRGADEFHRQFSFDSWCETIRFCFNHFSESNSFDSNRVLLIGHSEGGVVVSRLANTLKEKISHVAVLAGEGPSQLFSLLELTRKGDLLAQVSNDPEERVAYVLAEWEKILASPKNTAKQFYGFTYLRWHSFLSTSPAEELESATARIYIAQGLNDQAVAPDSARMLYAHLLSKGRDVQLNLVEGADHSFAIASKSDVDGWSLQLSELKNWFQEKTRVN